jgi:molecular chaperone DnaK (HSP70)
MNARFSLGIDLGTSNSAIGFSDLASDQPALSRSLRGRF